VAWIKPRKTKEGFNYFIGDRVNGEEEWFKTPATNKTEARICLDQYRASKALKGSNPFLIVKVNFETFVNTKFLEISRSHKTEKTFSADLRHLKFVVQRWKNRLISEITGEEIAMFQADCLKKGQSKKTINNRVALLSSILRMAQKHKIISEMPEINLMKLDKLPPKGFSDEEVRLILETAKARPDQTMFNYLVIYLNTGLRLSELQFLKWDEIDWVAKQLMVNKSKSHSFRVVPINQTLENHLKKLKSIQKNKQVYLFEHNEKPFETFHFYNPFKKMLRKLGFKGNIHALRHTFASRLVRAGVSLYMVQKILGHSNISTTQRYAHLRTIDLEDAVKVLDNCGTNTEPSKVLEFKIA